MTPYWGQWHRCGGTEVMGKGWVALRGGHWGQMGWHWGGDNGDRCDAAVGTLGAQWVAPYWGHWHRCGGTEVGMWGKEGWH